jgi:RimJ/RimL family protein N-acetyltransferase
MVTKDDLIFRQVVTLRDGARVLIRPLTEDDRKSLMDLLLPIPPEEAQFLRHNITDPQVIAEWTENIEYEKVFPLVAVVGDRIVGNATLHFNFGPARHRAEVRIFLAKDFRRRGLGSRFIQALIEIAKRRSLYYLEAQIVSNQVDVIKAFQKIGFSTATVFEDYFILPDGDLRDVNHMILRLRTTEEEF